MWLWRIGSGFMFGEDEKSEEGGCGIGVDFFPREVAVRK